jgi:hypothetical protein
VARSSYLGEAFVSHDTANILVLCHEPLMTSIPNFDDGDWIIGSELGILNRRFSARRAGERKLWYYSRKIRSIFDGAFGASHTHLSYSSIALKTSERMR